VSTLEQEVRAVAALFEGRLPPAVILDALEYMQFNETGLALETLCQQLGDFQVPLTGAEYARLCSLAEHMYPDASILMSLAKQVVT
jgi:hypothetical protein